MKQKFTASIWQEDEWFVAQCVEVDVASQGKTEDEVLENLRDALEVHFTHLSLPWLRRFARWKSKSKLHETALCLPRQPAQEHSPPRSRSIVK
jgi:hypothetical protein